MPDGATWRVYPRGCGGTQIERLERAKASGLSPRVRGNPRPVRETRRYGRSIPAGAGEPGISGWTVPTTTVYPRGCGGTPASRGVGRYGRGLSPRVRGNLRDPVDEDDAAGSIPAGAGEPGGVLPGVKRRGVYPRGCGGTKGHYTLTNFLNGLSPRVRGNRTVFLALTTTLRSIPRGCGGTLLNPRNARKGQVYPRGCGGTGVLLMGNDGGMGLYPRGCGGTVGAGSHLGPPIGLSPRVRGNLTSRRSVSMMIGSIPAGAGEPYSMGRLGNRARVYPRGCGGTIRQSCR